MKDFIYRLFFTRDDDLDLLQVFFLGAIVFFYVAFGLEASGVWHPSETAWRIMERVFYILALLGVPMWALDPLLRFLRVRGEAKDATGS